MDSNEEPKHIFDFPSCILGLMLWASRVLVCIKLWHCDISIIKMSLMIILYFIMEFVICFICGIIKYLPVIIKDPTYFIICDKKDLINNDPDFSNLISGITTIAYLIIYFL